MTFRPSVPSLRSLSLELTTTPVPVLNVLQPSPASRDQRDAWESLFLEGRFGYCYASGISPLSSIRFLDALLGRWRGDVSPSLSLRFHSPFSS